MMRTAGERTRSYIDALHIVRATKHEGYTKPMPTEFYYWYAGEEHQKSVGLKDLYSYKNLREISRKDWQDAKEEAYPDYDFKASK